MYSKPESLIMQNWMGDPDKPLVSIRCATYNQEKYIAQCLDGFLMQETTFPFEVVVHDDASTDKTAEIIREYEKKYPTIIRPIYEKENQYSKWNGTIRRIMDSKTRGKYTASCEGDDYWIDSQKLQRQVSFLEEHDEYSMVFHAADYIKDGEKVDNDQRSPVECDFSVNDIIKGGGGFCATASLCIRTKLRAARFSFQEHASVGDYPMQIAMSLRGKVHYFPETMAVYRVESNGSWSTEVMNDWGKKIRLFQNEISWLQELDDFTEKKYHNAIQYRIAMMNINLLSENIVTYTEAKNEIAQLTNEDQKLLANELKNARIHAIKNQIKNHLPLIYQIYKRYSEKEN